MASPSKKDAEVIPIKRRPPATTIQAREHELVNLAFDHAERMLRDGTASSQVTIHYLKLGTVREQAEREKLRLETALLQARTDQIANGAKQEEIYQKALNAMRAYQGQDVEDELFD